MRSGFFIHGGDIPGSAGCIDMLRNETQLSAQLAGANGDGECCCYIPLKVSYTEGLVVHATYTTSYTDNEQTVYGP